MDIEAFAETKTNLFGSLGKLIGALLNWTVMSFDVGYLAAFGR